MYNKDTLNQRETLNCKLSFLTSNYTNNWVLSDNYNVYLL